MQVWQWRFAGHWPTAGPVTPAWLHDALGVLTACHNAEQATEQFQREAARAMGGTHGH